MIGTIEMIIRPRGKPINGKHPRTAMPALGQLQVGCFRYRCVRHGKTGPALNSNLILSETNKYPWLSKHYERLLSLLSGQPT